MVQSSHCAGQVTASGTHPEPAHYLVALRLYGAGLEGAGEMALSEELQCAL